MIRLLLRLAALLLLASAFAVVVVDCARSLADSALVLTSLSEALAVFAPHAQAALAQGLERASFGWLWEYALRFVFAAPASLVLALCGTGLMRAMRRRRNAFEHLS